jgi:hypothetical protein
MLQALKRAGYKTIGLGPIATHTSASSRGDRQLQSASLAAVDRPVRRPLEHADGDRVVRPPATSWLKVLTVEEYETQDGKPARRWTQVGVAFPHKDGTGLNVGLRCLPLNGRLVILPLMRTTATAADCGTGSAAS